MSYKHFVLDTSEDWDTYWTQTTIQEEIAKTNTDGLLPIFKKYLSKDHLNLEAGCGLGKWVIILKRLGYQIIGLDNYTKGLQILKKHDPKLILHSSDVQHLALQNNSIDAYISLGVVEHFEVGPQQALREAFRVTKPGGLALIEVPFDSPLRQLVRRVHQLRVILKTPFRILLETFQLREPRKPLHLIFYEYRYTREELHDFCRQAGFTVDAMLPKDDLARERSIMLWSDFVSLRHPDNQLFHLNYLGQIVKSVLSIISPFSFPALIVAICHKPKS